MTKETSKAAPNCYWKDGETFPRNLVGEYERLKWHVRRTHIAALEAESALAQARADIIRYEQLFDVSLITEGVQLRVDPDYGICPLPKNPFAKVADGGPQSE